jgi:transcription initiation factor IIE alpha subunit
MRQEPVDSLKGRKASGEGRHFMCPSCLIKWAFTERQRGHARCPVCNVPLLEEKL